MPSFIQNDTDSSIRTMGKTLEDGKVFKQMTRTYDAYEKDIAVVQVKMLRPTRRSKNGQWLWFSG